MSLLFDNDNDNNIIMESGFIKSKNQINKTIDKDLNDKLEQNTNSQFYRRNIGSIFKNMITNTSKNFEGLRPNLLKMVSRCKTIDDINYLRKDINIGKVQLKRLAINNPDRKKAVDDHIEWLNTVYRNALNEKAKEIREKNK